MFTFCKTEKNRKENHETKVTKIPKTKRRKYGMNETYNAIFETPDFLKICPNFGRSFQNTLPKPPIINENICEKTTNGINICDLSN